LLIGNSILRICGHLFTRTQAAGWVRRYVTTESDAVEDELAVLALRDGEFVHGETQAEVGGGGDGAFDGGLPPVALPRIPSRPVASRSTLTISGE
jgi:hypothetical protein